MSLNTGNSAAAAAATVLAEYQRPMYAIPTEGCTKQPDSSRYGEDINQTLSMQFKPREPMVIRPPDTRSTMAMWSPARNQDETSKDRW